jgi:hypothetical protein
MHVVSKKLTLLLWDVVVERMEILWSNVFSFFLASVAGDEVEAERLTALFMDTAVPACLAPLFVGINSTSVEPLGQGRSVSEDPKHQRRREAIEVHYGSVSRTAMGVFQTFFKSYDVKLLPTYEGHEDESDTLRDVIKKFLDIACVESASGKPPPKPKGLCFSKTGLLSVSDAVDKLKVNFQYIQPLGVVQHKDPSLMGSPSFESRSNVRDFIKPCLFGSSISEKDVYSIVRRLITAAFESNVAFYYLFAAKDAARTRIPDNGNLFVLMFAKKRLDPLSAFLSDEEKRQIAVEMSKFSDSATVWKLKNRAPYRPPSRPASASTVSGSTQKNIVKKVSKSSKSKVVLNSDNTTVIQMKRQKKPAVRIPNPKQRK